MEQPTFFFVYYHVFVLMIWLTRYSVFGLEEHKKVQWMMLQPNIRVSAMHMQLLPNDRDIVFDRTDFCPSNLTLTGGLCRHDRNNRALPVDCTGNSVEYNVAGNTFRQLTVLTDTWCSSGGLVQTGGLNDGERASRSSSPALTETGRRPRPPSPCRGGTPPTKRYRTVGRS